MSDAKSTTRVNLRTGPGVEYPVLLVVEAGAPVTVISDSGDWLEVQSGGQRGFAAARFIVRETQTVPAGFTGRLNAPLAPQQLIRLGTRPSAADKLAAATWNRCGGLLDALARQFKFDAGCAVAVFATESSGAGFGPDGRMVIRFENHHFHRYWGVNNPAVFNGHFRFNAAKQWTGHEWRESASSPFQPVHASQDSEWAAFEYASALDENAAKLSISMGGPQILGSNYAEAGFETVGAMFDAFAADERAQIAAFFDFVQGTGTNPRKILALQRRDFVTFAALYNGPGNAPQYGEKISGVFEAFARLRAAAASTVTA